jgi:predicted nucleic acid-binding Zn ribbon protein
MEQLKSALNTALKREGLDSAVRQNKALLIWEEVVGKAVAENCIPEEMKKGVLIVRARTPVWRNEIAIKKKEIIEKLNTKLGKETIKDIRVL